MKGLTQGDLEKLTGLLRSYISRVESGRTVPSVETLEKLSRGMDTPLYQFFYEPKGHESESANIANAKLDCGLKRKERRMFRQIRDAVSGMSMRDRSLLLYLAAGLARRRRNLPFRKK